MRNILRYVSFSLVLMVGVVFNPELVTPQEIAAADTALISNATIPAAPEVTLAPVALAAGPITPSTLSIPSIDLATDIVPVGLNKKGEMDVPSGKTTAVGWYQGGTKPGQVGSAVLDAHVFAAFKGLTQVKVGDSVYVTDASGKKLRFVVEKTEVTPLKKTSAQKLFMQSDKARLNLITCAGTFSKALGTYDHRLVVYAVLAS